jgi:hypothetical protein
MNAKEKLKHVKDMILAKATISPSGPFRVRLYDQVAYEEGPTILSRADQWSILQKLEEDGFIKNVWPDESDGTIWVEMPPRKVEEEPKKNVRRNNTYSHIKSVDDLLQHRELFERFRKMLGDNREIKAGHSYVYPTDESNDDLVQLLADLKLISYEWEKLDLQTHRPVGNRIIEFTYDADKILPVLARVSGKGGVIRKAVIELISNEIGARFSLPKIVQVFEDLGVPETMFIQDTKWRGVFYVLSYYATSETERLQLLKILEGIVHPLMFGGDEKKAQETQEKYRQWLKYDRIHIDERGKLFLGPTEEEIELGMDDWVSADGKTTEPSTYLIYPEHVAELSILWTQIMMLAGAYRNRTGADHRELEKLYLEILGKVELLISVGKLGDLKEKYKRPFASLATSDIETEKNGGVAEALNSFLKKINEAQPDPQEMQKQIEANEELIMRVIEVSRLIVSDTEQTNFNAISKEQAIFLLKLVFGNMFKILDAIASGPISIADEDLNEKYVLLYDALEKLLERPDLKEFKEQITPDLLPSHLFENWGDLDVWWEYGNQRLMGFYGDIEKRWILAGRRVFPVIGELGILFDSVDGRVGEHNRLKSSRWGQILKNVDEGREHNDFTSAPPKPDTDAVEVKLADGGLLALNKLTGSVRLNTVSSQLNPESQEYRFLLKLMTAKNYQAVYKDLLVDQSKTSRRNLSFVVRNLKTGLGILPKDVIKNIKSYGYKLIT